jgi:hypothetical protein
LDTKGWSTLYAWGDYNPIIGLRSGDAEEIQTENGCSYFHPEDLTDLKE